MTATSTLSPSAKSPHNIRILAILSALMAFASISTDLYLPAMPHMADALSADSREIELTVSGYLIGFSLGQLVWGPIADRYGRRLPVAIGLVLFIIGSAGCALSTSANMMISWRVLQAVGACSSVVLARAMVSDLYKGVQAAQMMSTLMTVMAIAPLLGPIIGGQILSWSSWRTIFWLLVVVGMITLISVSVLPESLPRERRREQSLRLVCTRYATLLGQLRFWGYAATSGFFYAGTFAYIAGSPFSYIDHYHVPSAAYGFLFGAGIIGVMVSNQINVRLLRQYPRDRLLQMGALIAALAGVALVLNTWDDWGGLPLMATSLFAFVSATGFIIANSISGALENFPEFSGSVSALIGSLQYGSGIVGSAMVAAFGNGTPRSMGFVVACCGLGCLLSALFLIPRVTSQIAQHEVTK